MKNLSTQYLWIFSITAALLLAIVLLVPEKKNRLDFIEEEIQKVQEHQEILTEKEKQLEKMATEKDWEEVDKETDK